MSLDAVEMLLDTGPTTVEDRTTWGGFVNRARAVVDGNYRFALLALNLAAEKASRQGIAMVTVRKCGWFAAPGPDLHTLTREGYLAQLWAQTTTCRDAAPYGGIDAKCSINTIAMAFPTKKNPDVSDFSTTTISVGKTKRMAQSDPQV